MTWQWSGEYVTCFRSFDRFICQLKLISFSLALCSCDSTKEIEKIQKQCLRTLPDDISPKVWNQLPTEIKSKTSFLRLKNISKHGLNLNANVMPDDLSYNSHKSGETKYQVVTTNPLHDHRLFCNHDPYLMISPFWLRR